MGLLGKANELQVIHINAAYLETTINENLKRLGNVEVLDIKFHDEKVLIIYKKN